MSETSQFFRARGDHDADQALVESRLAGIVYRCLLDAMIVMDQEGLIREFNRQAERLFGHARDDVIGLELAELIVPEEMREAHRRGILNYLSSGEGPVINNRIEIEGLCKGGDRVPIELAISAEKIDGETIFVATLRDLTEEKRKQAELEQVRGYLDNVVEYGPTIFYVIRGDESAGESFTWISPNISSILDFDPAVILSGAVPWEQRLHPDDRARVLEQWDATWTEEISKLEYRILDMSNRVRWIREARRVVTSDSKKNEVIGSLEDITESRRSEHRERNLRRELDHRVKNNLQVILSECDKAISSEEVDRQRIVGLTSRIASMAIVHQALADRSWSSIDLRELFRHSEKALIEPGGTQRIRYDGPELAIAVDAGMTLGAVIYELINNATKYGGLSVDDGIVEVAWRIQGEGDEAMVMLRWQETVPGIEVKEPRKKNFGMQLIESMIPYELNGEVTLDFKPGGLHFNASIPLNNCRLDIGRVRGRIEDEGTVP